MQNIKDFEEWKYSNLDLVEEGIENGKKPIILIGGASSSGKSFTSKKLCEFLINKGYRVVILSSDSYNKGLSQNIFEIVNKKYFSNKIKNSEKIIEKIKNIIINSNFSSKFDKDNINKIKHAIKHDLNVNMSDFLKYLKYEFDHINFDQKDIYDLKVLSQDIKTLIDGKILEQKSYSKLISEREKSNIFTNGRDVDVIIVEGIYALCDEFVEYLSGQYLIKNFIECDDKNLFLRRVIRDCKITDCPNSFIVKNYFEFVSPEYKNNVIKGKNNADLVLENNMTCEELRHGTMNTQQKFSINKEFLNKILKSAKILYSVNQEDIYFGKPDDENILRLRLQNGELFDLVYKGHPKTRKDKKTIRPMSTLLCKTDLEKIAKTKDEMINLLSSCGIGTFKTVKKKRCYLKLFDETIKLDIVDKDMYIEVDCMDSSIFKLLKGTDKQIIENICLDRCK